MGFFDDTFGDGFENGFWKGLTLGQYDPNKRKNPDDEFPDPFQGIGDAFSSPYAKIALLAGVGYLAYSMLKDDK